MEQMIGFHAMKLAIRGFRNVRETSKQHGNKVFHRFIKGKGKREKIIAYMVINLDDGNKNKYFAMSRI